MIKPLFIVKPKTISRRDIKRAEEHAGICIVECSDPDSTRFLDPPPAADLDVQARAAISLMRMINKSSAVQFQRSELNKWFVDMMLDWKAQPATVPPVQPPKASK